MLFGLDEVDGERVRGWLHSDGRQTDPAVVAVLDGTSRHVIGAADSLPISDGDGAAPPGARGFLIDASTCPGWDRARTLELYDLGTNLLMFRRPSGPACRLRHVHFEPQGPSSFELARALAPHMAMSYTSAELMDDETLIGVLGITHCPSLLVCGDLFYRPYAAYLRARALTRSIRLADPLGALANALLRARMLGQHGGDARGWKDLGQPQLNRAFRDVDLIDPKAIAVALDTLSDRARASLADPLTRKLAANTPDDVLHDHHVETALGALAEFEIVGFDHDLRAFADSVAALAGLSGLDQVTSACDGSFLTIKAAVATCESAHDLVRLDRIVYELASAAIQAV